MYRGHLKLLVVAFSDRLDRPDVNPDQLRHLVKCGEFLEGCGVNGCHESTNISALDRKTVREAPCTLKTGNTSSPWPSSPFRVVDYLLLLKLTALGDIAPCSFGCPRLSYSGPLSTTTEGYLALPSPNRAPKHCH